MFYSVTGVNAQPLDITFEFQAYPTGLIPGLRIEKGFGDKNAAHLRLAANLFDHRDLGVQDEERGNGFGFTVGYKRYFKSDFKGLSLGLRNDIWFNTVDWVDNSSLGGITGTTKIVVVQPTAELGYLLEFGNNWVFTPALGFGYEINVKTDGVPTGEGAILLLGFSVGKRL
ncbi:MAG: hypothetical protein DWQ02_15740 [Bacteroidetes bacterium]|nr:MAG: hypothetical protein DWQ02_15740 [Bacteroidota bacterium]